MPPPTLPSAPGGAGKVADVDRIRTSWTQQTEFSSPQGVPVIKLSGVAKTFSTSNSLQTPPSNPTETSQPSPGPSMPMPKSCSPADLPKFSTPSTNRPSEREMIPIPRAVSVSKSPKSPSSRSHRNLQALANVQRRINIAADTNRDMVQVDSESKTNSPSSYRETPAHLLDTAPHGIPALFSSPAPISSPRAVLARPSPELCSMLLAGWMVDRALGRKEEGDMLLRRLYDKMQYTRQVKEKGLVHCKIAEVSWIVLGQVERNTGITSRVDRDEKDNIVCNEKAVIEYKYPPCGDINITNVDENFKSYNFDEDSDDENWYSRPNDNMPVGVSYTDSLFNSLNTLARNTISSLWSQGSLSVTPVKAETSITDKNVQFKTPSGEVIDEEEPEELGTCPLCQKEMMMRVLQQHASDCQGP